MSYASMPSPSGAPMELNLRDHLDVLRRRRDVFVLVFLVALVLGVVAAARTSKPVYQTHAKILVPASSYSLSVIDSNNPIGGMLAAAQPDSVDTQLQVLQSAPFLADAQRIAKITPKPDVSPPSAAAEAVEGTNVILVTVTGGDPNDCAKLANTIVDLHLERTDLLTTTGMKDTILFVRAEKQKAEQRLADAEHKILEFRKAHRGIDLASEREARAGEYTALLARVLELDSSVKTVRTQIGSLQARLAKEPAELVQVVTRENPRIAKLQDKVDDLLLQRTDLLREYRPSSRLIQDLDTQVTRLQQQLAAAPKVQRVRTYLSNPNRAPLLARLEELEATLQAQEENHRAALAQFTAKKGVLDNLGPWEAEMGRLTRDRDATQGAFTMLSDRLRDLEIRAGARMRTARAIERAGVPTSPLPTQKTKNIIMAALLALMLAISTVFLQEFLDDRVNTPEEMERISPLRTLARVPLMGTGQPRLMSALPAHSAVAESYRGLRAGVGFAAFDSPIRRLLITSAAPGEGKSTTAVNLATAMARDGKCVVLMDADMRSPSVHRFLELPQSPGLSQVLAGMTELTEALRQTEIENLIVLPAGTIPPNPAELLGSDAFLRVLEQLDELADVIVVDSPPCAVVTDPVIVAARMDGVVLVVHVGQTRKTALKQTTELLEHARARVVGVVYNQVQPHGSGYYYSHYRYYQNGHTNGHQNGHMPHARNGKAPQPDREEKSVVPVNVSQEDPSDAS
jgi:capsular exopolysaccharide synthesis family protein